MSENQEIMTEDQQIMSEDQEIINCSLKVKSKYVHNPGYEESGSITIRLLQKTQIGETSMDRDTSNIQDIYSTPSSEKISKRLFRLCSEDYTDYCVESLLQTLEVDPNCINWLKPNIVSAVLKRAIETAQDNMYREFEVIADIELTTIDLISRESAMEEEDLERVMMESIEETNVKRNSALESSIKKLKRGYFEGGVGDELGMKNCGVCLDDFEIGSKFVWMPCSHMFHEGCLIRWLEESKSCPLCRLGLTD